MTEVREQAVATPGLGSLFEKRSRRLAAAAFVRGAALVPVIGVLLIVGSVISPVFLTTSNLAQVGREISALGVVVVGEALIIIIGGMDLSLESTFGLSAMVGAWLIIPTANYGQGVVWSPYLGIVALLAVGVAVGFVNGLAIVKGRLNGFIWTLGMTVVLGGIQDGMVNGQSLYNLPSEFGYLGGAYVGAVPVSLIVAIGIFVLAGLFLRYHRFGRDIYAVGGSQAAARAAGTVGRIHRPSTAAMRSPETTIPARMAPPKTTYCMAADSPMITSICVRKVSARAATHVDAALASPPASDAPAMTTAAIGESR